MTIPPTQTPSRRAGAPLAPPADLDSLARDNERLRLAQVAADMGTWEWFPGSNEVFWSPEMEAIFGVAPGTFPRSFDAFLAAVHPDDRERMVASIDRLIHEGEHEIEHRIVLPEGRVKWLQARGKMFRDASGTPVRAVGVGMDITGRHRVEERQELLSQVSVNLSASLDPEITLTNLARTIVPAFADSCNFVLLRDDGQQWNVASVWNSSEQQSRAEVIRNTYPGDPAVRVEFERMLLVGRSIFIPDAASVVDDWARSPEHARALRDMGLRSIIMSPMRARDATFGAAVFISAESGRNYDAHDLRTAEEITSRASLAIDNALLHRSVEVRNTDLENALTAKDEFLAMVSHELRTPVTVLSAASHVLHNRIDTLDRDSLREVAGDLREQCDRLNQMVENLLALARHDIAHDVGNEPVLVYHITERLLGRFRQANPGRAFELSESGSPVPVAADTAYLELIITNLVSNAMKYSPAGSPITIAITRSTEEVFVAVRDIGTGVAESEIGAIFDRFYRAKSTSTMAGGAGMGLAVVKRLVEAMDGRVWARNLEGRGFEVGFSLPSYPGYEPD